VNKRNIYLRNGRYDIRFEGSLGQLFQKWSADRRTEIQIVAIIDVAVWIIEAEELVFQ